MKQYEQITKVIGSMSNYHDIFLYYTVNGREFKKRIVVTSPLTQQEMEWFIQDRTNGIDVVYSLTTFATRSAFEECANKQGVGWNGEYYGLDSLARVIKFFREIVKKDREKKDRYEVSVVRQIDGRVFRFNLSAKDQESFNEFLFGIKGVSECTTRIIEK